jgi:hypothetical protein
LKTVGRLISALEYQVYALEGVSTTRANRKNGSSRQIPGWQQTTAGEREVQKALRKALLKYQLHREQELFDKAYAYIKQHY